MIVCNCRFSLCDTGYFECQLPKGHNGNHFFKTNDLKRNYEISWEQDKDKDIIFDLKKVYELTNLKEVLNILRNNQYVEEININDKSFNEPIYGEEFTLTINYIGDFHYDLKKGSFEEVYKKEKEITKIFYENWNGSKYSQIHIHQNCITKDEFQHYKEKE